MNATANELRVGQVVRYSNPASDAERAARFTVVELRGDRVLIRFACDLPIPPTEVVAVNEVVAAD